LSEVVLVFVVVWVSFFWSIVEGAFSEQVSMLMTPMATEWNMFIINGLDLVLVLIFQNDGPRERLSYIQVDADAGIGGITPLLRGLRRFDIYANGITDTRQNLFKPELLWKRI
jgi:hypothetical protein